MERQKSIIIFHLFAHFAQTTTVASWRNTNSDRTHDFTLQVSELAVRLLFRPFIIYPYLVRPSGVVIQGSFIAPLLPRDVAHRNRESVDYIADTTLRFLFRPVSPYLRFHFQIRVVVISQPASTHASHVVPVYFLCRTVIKHVVNVPIRTRLLLAYQSNTFARKSSQSIRHIY